MSFITKILESILPFLFSALKRSWDNLTKVQQDALVNSGVIGQYLKNNLTALGGDLVTAIATHTGLPSDTVEGALIAIAKEFGLSTTSVNEAVAFLQSKLQAAESTPLWNGLLSTLLNVGGTILSGGTVDWVHVALGLGEYVYQKFVKPVNLLPVTVKEGIAAVPVQTDTEKLSAANLSKTESVEDGRPNV